MGRSVVKIRSNLPVGEPLRMLAHRSAMARRQLASGGR
jgi:hypothetical protein